ncbi:uncharacterized protein MONBRDRAFT_23510 [Monosiga brevicollis MX1]|uniref:RING-type E3 ubiquitin transferase n=1 Tax=Monosiga brevicollis TaxID=81824 RepID=A9UTM4_MONBE|nr:uncharacterized protein MONBRDRAFT_23510 [Monosiga brevicollis MX1]EDQ91271.1 predicted protein [Monosiga brevicollis MX1]|eukprot:XP_001743693.1 hypothetical protein [Monosiga brevicollis MX1]
MAAQLLLLGMALWRAGLRFNFWSRHHHCIIAGLYCYSQLTHSRCEDAEENNWEWERAEEEEDDEPVRLRPEALQVPAANANDGAGDNVNADPNDAIENPDDAMRLILRKGTLWFFRDPYDPAFHPIKYIVKTPLVAYLVRFLVVLVLMNTIAYFIFHLGSRMASWLLPSTLPWNLLIRHPLEFVLANMTIPLVWVRTLTSVFLLAFVPGYRCHWVGLYDYMLPPPTEPVGPDAAVDNGVENDEQEGADGDERRFIAAGGAAAVPQNDVLPDVEAEVDHSQNGEAGEDQDRPLARDIPLFYPRLTVLVFMGLVTLSLLAAIFFVLPALAGRPLLKLCGATVVHEYFTLGVSLLVLYGAGFLGKLCVTQARQERLRVILTKFARAVLLALKIVVPQLSIFCLTNAILQLAIFSTLTFGILPIIMGVSLELAIFVPISLVDHTTPMISLWQSWALGVMALNCILRLLTDGPALRIKIEIDRQWQAGLAGFSLTAACAVVLPLIGSLLFFLLSPIPIVFGILPALLPLNDRQIWYGFYYLYPTMVCAAVAALVAQAVQRKLAGVSKIVRDDQYLIGTRLLNAPTGSTDGAN